MGDMWNVHVANEAQIKRIVKKCSINKINMLRHIGFSNYNVSDCHNIHFEVHFGFDCTLSILGRKLSDEKVTFIHAEYQIPSMDNRFDISTGSESFKKTKEVKPWVSDIEIILTELFRRWENGSKI